MGNDNGGDGKTFFTGEGTGSPKPATDFTVNPKGNAGGSGTGEVDRQLSDANPMQKTNRSGDPPNPKSELPGGPLPFNQPRNPSRDVGVGGQSNKSKPYKLR